MMNSIYIQVLGTRKIVVHLQNIFTYVDKPVTLDALADNGLLGMIY